MSIRNLIVFALLAMTCTTLVGCGSSNTTVTPVKDATPQPAAAPASGADST